MTWTKEYQRWMRTRGVLVNRRPRRGLGPNSVRVYWNSIRKVLQDLGYLDEDEQISKRIRDLTPEELVDWMEETFSELGDGEESKWNYYAKGIIKLSQYLYHEARDHGKRVFSKKDLELVQEKVFIQSSTSTGDTTLTLEFMKRYEEEFLPWLKDRSQHMWAFAAFSFHTAFRYSEVRGMDLGLKSGSVIRQHDGTVVVEGKRVAGSKRFDRVGLLPPAEQVLKEWAGMRRGILGKDHEHDTKALFITQQEKGRWGRNPGNYNQRLRFLARESGFFEGTCDDRGSHPTGELVLIRSHVAGRKLAVTRNVSHGVSSEDGMDFSRHKTFRIYKERYALTDPADVAERIYQQITGVNGSDETVEEKAEVLSEAMDDEMKRALLKALMKDLDLI